MKLKLNEKPVRVRHLDDYIKCPNYAKYNWTNHEIRKSHYLYNPLRSVILSCYRDLSNLEKEIAWKTVRGRVHESLAPLLDKDIPVSDYRSVALSCLGQIRNWYLRNFRGGSTACIHNLWLESRVPGTGVNITGGIDAITIAPNQIKVIEITDKFKDVREAVNALSIKSKVWMLKQEGVKVDQIQFVRILKRTSSSISVFTDTLIIQDYNDFIYKTERAIQWATGSIKHQIYHPSITSMCGSCPYKQICSW